MREGERGKGEGKREEGRGSKGGKGWGGQNRGGGGSCIIGLGGDGRPWMRVSIFRQLFLHFLLRSISSRHIYNSIWNLIHSVSMR